MLLAVRGSRTFEEEPASPCSYGFYISSEKGLCGYTQCVLDHSLNHSKDSGFATLAFVLTSSPDNICLTATSILFVQSAYKISNG